MNPENPIISSNSSVFADSWKGFDFGNITETDEDREHPKKNRFGPKEESPKEEFGGRKLLPVVAGCFVKTMLNYMRVFPTNTV